MRYEIFCFVKRIITLIIIMNKGLFSLRLSGAGPLYAYSAESRNEKLRRVVSGRILVLLPSPGIVP